MNGPASRISVKQPSGPVCDPRMGDGIPLCGEMEMRRQSASILKRTRHRKRPPTYTVQLPDGTRVDKIKLNDITDHVSIAELERFEHHQFALEANSVAAVECARPVAARSNSGSPLSSLTSSMFEDSAASRWISAQSPDARRQEACDRSWSREHKNVGILETSPGVYVAPIHPGGIQSSVKWVATRSLISARTIETGVDDQENPEWVAFIAQSGELEVRDTGYRGGGELWGTVDENDNTRGMMSSRRQKDWFLLPLVPAIEESSDLVAVSPVAEVVMGNLAANVEVQRHRLMNPATVNVGADLYLEVGGDGRKLVGSITSVLIDKSVLDSNGCPAWLNRTRGPPPLLIDMFDHKGKVLPGLRTHAAQLEENRILIIDGFWFEADYDTPDVAPEDAFFAALPHLANGYAFEGTIVVAPNQLKNPANKESLINKWKKSGFEVWQEWVEEEAPLVLGRTWTTVDVERDKNCSSSSRLHLA